MILPELAILLKISPNAPAVVDKLSAGPVVWLLDCPIVCIICFVDGFDKSAEEGVKPGTLLNAETGLSVVVPLAFETTQLLNTLIGL